MLDRFDRFGEPSNLRSAITNLRIAVDLTPTDHSERPSRAGQLGLSLMEIFRSSGSLSDLDEAVAMLQDAVDLLPTGHPDKPERYTNLGISLAERSKTSGELSDLEDAVTNFRQAIALTPRDQLPNQGLILYRNLGQSLLDSFDRVGRLSDL